MKKPPPRMSGVRAGTHEGKLTRCEIGPAELEVGGVLVDGPMLLGALGAGGGIELSDCRVDAGDDQDRSGDEESEEGACHRSQAARMHC